MSRRNAWLVEALELLAQRDRHFRRFVAASLADRQQQLQQPLLHRPG